MFVCESGDIIFCFDYWEFELNKVVFGDECDMLMLVVMVDML